MPKCRRGKHSNIKCGTLLQRKSGDEIKCNWHIKRELLIPFDIDPRFLFYARTKPVQEIVFAPYLCKKIPDWNQHYTNRELLRMPLTWDVAFQACENIRNMTKVIQSQMWF